MRSRRTGRRSRYLSRLPSIVGSPCEGRDLNHGKTVGLTAFARCDFPDSNPFEYLVAPRQSGAAAMRGKGFEPLDHRETLPARFARRTATPVVSFAPAGRSRDLYRSGFRVRRGRIAVCFIIHGIYAREERPREGVFRTAEQCEGRDLNHGKTVGPTAFARCDFPDSNPFEHLAAPR